MSILCRFLLLLVLAGSVAAGDFPDPPDTQPVTTPLLSAEEALAGMQLPEGFQATVFASEPDLRNPIAACWDGRGRLWVAENFTYGDSRERYNLNLRDRIVVLEDTDHDGRHDKRTVFTDRIQMLTSIERGLGGIWALAPPHLLFFPDRNGDDVPDGPPEVVLEGFSTQAASHHTFANGLKWGPDGWLYGRIGISSTSFIGVPGTPEKDRPGTAGGLWRYHPVRKSFDIVCAGTTNPWGSDWDRHGELFFINTVIGHLWQGIHGAHFRRMFGQDLNPRTYELMDMIADHYHWDTGGTWQDSRAAAGGSDVLGGGHAHSGMLIYQGLNWPESYRDKLLTINFGGRRVNVERLERNGAGYTGRHEPDILRTNDPWFRGIDLTCGPEGAVYVLDWSDVGECHDSDGIHRSSGRIYRITGRPPTIPPELGLPDRTSEELVKLQESPNEWLVRQARLELRERVFRGVDLRALVPLLESGFRSASTTPRKLNFWWTLEILAEQAGRTDAAWSAASDRLRAEAAASDDPYLLSWAARMAADGFAGNTLSPERQRNAVALLEKLASTARDPAVRLAVASCLPLLPLALRTAPAEALLAHGDDAGDDFLPLMYLYGIMDLPPAELVGLFGKSRLALVRRFIARRCAEDIRSTPGPLNELLSLRTGHAEILTGMTEALKGWVKAPQPAAWEEFAASIPGPAPSPEALSMGVLFGNGRALQEIRALALDAEAPLAARDNALRSLVIARPPDLRSLCEKLVGTRGLNVTALQGLALFDDPAVGETLCRSYAAFYPAEKPAVLEVLTSRPSFARTLLQHIGSRGIPRDHLTAHHARQIRNLGDPDLIRKFEAVWGRLRDTPADKKELMAALRKQLTPESLQQADLSAGRVLFRTLCSTCHRLYGEGQLIGPDLTGSGRQNPEYLIENIADPGALLANEYRLTVLKLKDGRVLGGIASSGDGPVLTLKMVGQEESIPREWIDGQEQSDVSLMPEGLLSTLDPSGIRDLLAYLLHDGQVPLPANSP